MTAGYHLFPTQLGPCGVAWSERGLLAVQLPEATREATEARLQAKARSAREASPPAWVAKLARKIAAHVGGTTHDFSDVRLDDAHLPAFQRRIYQALREVPAGTTASYGDLAERAGSPGAARAVGGAMGKNPWPIVVPCHRVLGAGKSTGGFSAFGGTATKVRLLAYEGAATDVATWLMKQDKVLGRFIKKVGPFPGDARGLTPSDAPSTFEVLAKSIVYQQLNGRAAATIWGRVQALAGAGAKGTQKTQGAKAGAPSRLTADVVLRAKDTALRGAGLSQNKMLAIRDLAERQARGEIPSLEDLATLDDAAIVETLTRVRGVGPWTVQMLLIFRLGRPDVLPALDYGVQQGFKNLYGTSALPKPIELAEHGERWSPYRSVASWYLWRAAEMLRPAKTKPSATPSPPAPRKRR